MANFSGMLAALVAAGTLSLVSTAHAGTTKAWTAAAKSLPADTAVAVGVDVSAVASSATFAKVFPMIVAKSEDFKQGLELMKTTCKLDPMSVVKSVAVGLDANVDDGIVFIQAPGLDAQKVAACIKDIAAAKGVKSDKIDVKTEGGITELSEGDKKIDLAWMGDVIALAPMHVDDRAVLKKWMAGGFAKGALGKIVAKVNTGSAVFVASSVTKDVDATHKMKGGYGWVGLASGNLSIEFHGDLGDAAGAKELATQAAAQVDEARKNPPLPAVGAMLKNVTVASAGTEVVGKATVVEKDFADLIGMILATQM